MSHTVSELISDETLNKIIQIESAGKPAIKARTSSALGLFQFLNATWLGMVRDEQPSWAQGKTTQQLLALRTDPAKSIEMGARFTENNARALGGNYTDGDLYLAHFLGVGTAKKLLRAVNQDASVEPLVGEAAVRANKSILQGKTVAQVRNWASRKMANAGGEDWIAMYWQDQEEAFEDIPDDAEPTRVDSAEDIVHSALPDDPTPHGQTSDAIANYQKALIAMGYYEIGIVDGSWGGATSGAISAFLNDHGINRAADLSEANTALIMKEFFAGFKRPIGKQRAEVTPKELAEHNPTMRSTLRTKALGFWGSITGGVGLAFQAVTTYFSGVWDSLKPVRQVMAEVPMAVWISLGLAICLGLYWNAQRAEKDTKEAFAQRRLLR